MPPPQPARPKKTPWLRIFAALAVVVIAGLAYIGSVVDPSGQESTGGGGSVEEACGPAAQQPDVGNSFVAPCAINNIEVDGSYSDWSGVPVLEYDTEVFPEQTTAADLKVAWQVTWNRDALYVHAHVQDPSLRRVEANQPSQFFKGDGVSFEFGPDPSNLDGSAGLRNGKDLHLMLGVAPDGLLASANPARSGRFVAGSLVGDVEVQGQAVSGGYELEAAVPWSVLNVESPSQGQIYAMNLNVSDAARDGGTWRLGTMISSNPDRTGANQRHPGTWQRVVLASVP